MYIHLQYICFVTFEFGFATPSRKPTWLYVVQLQARFLGWSVSLSFSTQGFQQTRKWGTPAVYQFYMLPCVYWSMD